MSIESTLEYIHKTTWLGSKPGLSRTFDLLERLGNPHKKLKFVHVAGTNGKGSTCAFIASVLAECGYKTGLYTSPYINFFNERIRINGRCISDTELEKFTDEIRPHADSMTDPATEFEMITALAMKYFADNGCDIVVLEVGMGGELDSTNVIDTPECAVITSIGLDHTAQLGNTLSEVASAKAGIIKGGVTVSYESDGEAYTVIKNKCDETGTKLICADFSKIFNLVSDTDGSRFDFGDLKNIKIKLTGTYQPLNAAVALTALLALKDKGYNITDEKIVSGMAKTEWAGRFEILGKNPVFILDGAHNPHGMAAAAKSFEGLFGERKAHIVAGAMADKDVEGMFKLILPHAEKFYTVCPENARSMSAEKLAEKLSAIGAQAVSFGKDYRKAVKSAIKDAGHDGIAAALGSLYFSADIRKAYKEVTEE